MARATSFTRASAGWRGIDAAHSHPVIDRSFPLAEIADASRLQESGGHFGKIVVQF